MTTDSAASGDPSGGLRPPSTLVEPAWLLDALGHAGLRIVDLREASAWAVSRLPGAAHLDLAALGRLVDGRENTLLEAEEFETLMAQLGITSESTVVAYDDQWGLAAARLVWALHAQGHEHASVLNGGWDRWVEEGGPTMSYPVVPSPGRFASHVEPRVRADYDWIAARLGNEDVVLIDTRTPKEFSTGHIPGARLWDWFNATPPGSWDAVRPVEELLEEWEGMGIDPNSDVVVYCRSGMRAAHTYVALRHAGFSRVRLYDGSWQDWSARGGARG